MEAASKSSLVTALLDTVTGTINEPGPSRAQEQLMRSPSPKKRKLSPERMETPRCADKSAQPSSSSSDYGDDFDDDVFMELEASMQATGTTNTPIPDKIDQGQPGRRNHDGKSQSVIDLVEEFNDMDDDDSVCDNIVQSRQALGISTPKRQSKNLPAAKLEESPGDEFGNDLDGDIDFDAVELAATQSIQQLEPPSKSVGQSIAKPPQCSIY